VTHPEEVRATLALEDGMCLEGYGFGRQGETSGEVVFQTALSGYQEVLTDPSYLGQIVVMTYPHIGNYGVNRDDVESARPQVAGFVVREASTRASSWRASGELHRYLDEAGIVGIQGVDTRALTRHIRTHGAKRGIISTVEHDPEALVAKARASRSMIGLDLAREATCGEPYRWSHGPAGWSEPVRDLFAPPRDPFHVIAYDFGMKRNILRHLVAGGCDVTVVPATTTANEALALGPDGIFFSNGPGDPEPCGYAVEAARELMEARPAFGICLGHQILGLALGGKTYKLKCGHHGANHPVMDLATRKVEITSQNHGFAVDPSLFDDSAYVLTHVNLNDGTVEGFRHRDLPVFSVQYHPEASPGPHDSHYLFREFIAEMAARREGGLLTVARGVPPAMAAGAGG
jgi:carbamoyl-phosphate synthase small subunit